MSINRSEMDYLCSYAKGYTTVGYLVYFASIKQVSRVKILLNVCYKCFYPLLFF